MAEGRLSLKDVSERVGVSPGTLRRWVDRGLIPQVDGTSNGWTPAAAAHARIVARLRDRGHSIAQIKLASDEGRLAYGFVEDLFPRREAHTTLAEAAELTGLEPALIERVWATFGLPRQRVDELTDEDVQALQYIASVLAAGFPLVAFLQLTRVYGQALSQVADAETRLFHIYVHEPMIREGVPGLEMSEEMEHLARDLLPLASPLMDFIHQRFLQSFIEQDAVGHMESDLDGDADLGRLRVVIAFCDLAGYTRFTEEEGEEEALSYVERFIDSVTETLPEDARVIKTIGDEVMIVGQAPQALVDWAVDFQRRFADRPEPRIGMHYGAAIYRDGDYFGRDVNLASRVVARARGGEVLVTNGVTDVVRSGGGVAFEEIGNVKLKGFDEPRKLCRARQPD